MKKAHLIAHTHWDREWYRPFQYFRIKLVYVIDHLIQILEKEDDFCCFLLDGQTIVLDDYLEIKPENKERLKALIGAGKILVGPWYIQPEEFATDAESLIRNLMEGISRAEELGGSMMTGYLPDSFGHSSQMPQILKGFGIDSAVLMRGIDFDRIAATEFDWQGLNGDTVFSIYLRKGYMNAMFLSENHSVNRGRLKKLVAELGPLTASGTVLVMNGVDHAFAQKQAAELCLKKSGFTMGSLEEYIDEVRREVPKPKKLSGELITPRHHRVHTSIASTRIYQKQMNRLLATTLERKMEPLCALTSLMGAEYPEGLIRKAWRLLIQNQTHDGLGGCCTDEVHREMDGRFTAVRQISETLSKNHSRALACRISSEDLILTVFNTALTAGRHKVEAEVIVEDGFTLLDEKGDEVPVQILSIEDIDVSKESIWTLYLETAQPAKRISFVFHCQFDSILGYRSYSIREEKGSLLREPENQALSFENGYYQLNIEKNGSLTLYDKETKTEYLGLNTIEDTGEGGDTYNHSPLSQDSPRLTRDGAAEIRVIGDGPLGKNFLIIQELMIPDGLSPDGKSRSGTELPHRIETRVFAWKESRRIDFSMEIDNRARSHRLRVLFPFGEKVKESFAETHFGIIRRSTGSPDSGTDWPETPLPIYSMQRFAGLETGERSLTILNRGLTEYEVYQGRESVLAITLHRGVGMMGKANLPIRPGRPSGIEIPTPDAESIGLLKREYSLISGGKMKPGDMVRAADFYTAPVPAVQNRLRLDRIEKANKDFFKYLSIENLQSIIGKRFSENVPERQDLLYLKEGLLAVSAIKKSADTDALILRMFNPGTTTVEGEAVKIAFPHSRVISVNLLEKEIEELSGVDEYILPPVAPFSQITLKIERKEVER